MGASSIVTLRYVKTIIETLIELSALNGCYQYYSVNYISYPVYQRASYKAPSWDDCEQTVKRTLDSSSQN